MDAMIPMIFVQMLILIGPALAILAVWLWRTHKEDSHRKERRRIAEEKLRRVPRSMPEQERMVA